MVVFMLIGSHTHMISEIYYLPVSPQESWPSDNQQLGHGEKQGWFVVPESSQLALEYQLHVYTLIICITWC